MKSENFNNAVPVKTGGGMLTLPTDQCIISTETEKSLTSFKVKKLVKVVEVRCLPSQHRS